MEGKEKAAAAAVEVGAETIFEERSLPRSLTPFLTPWLLLLLLLPYHQFPSCQFSSGEKRGEREQEEPDIIFLPFFPDVDRLGLRRRRRRRFK